MKYAVAAGCSHTAGTGNSIDDCYVSVLERHYGFEIKNWAVPGGNCNHVLMAVVKAVQQDSRPTFVIAQWPNVFRRTLWYGDRDIKQNINSADDSFKLLLEKSEQNFYEPWMQSVIIANLLGKQSGTPIINILLESIEQKYLDRLAKSNIELHTDQKLPGLTWFFDSNAQDKLHHSPWCHQKWAERLIGIIDAYTTR